MPPKTACREVTVISPQGLHARPAHYLVQTASQFQSTIEICKDGESVDGKSILSLLTLAASQGTKLVVRATGVDAEDAVETLAGIIAQGFDEHEMSAESVPEQANAEQAGEVRRNGASEGANGS